MNHDPVPEPKFVPPPRTWARKFADAFAGMALGIKGQSSFAVHGLCFIAVMGLGWVFWIQPWQWAALVLVSALVLCLELVNSAIEALAVAITQQYSPAIDRALKVASGAVLVAAMFAVVIGAMIFVPRLMALWQAWS